jgi:hypothetical protein
MNLLERLGFKETDLERKLKLSIAKDLHTIALASWMQLLYFGYNYPSDISYDLARAKTAGCITSNDLNMIPLWKGAFI